MKKVFICLVIAAMSMGCSETQKEKAVTQETVVSEADKLAIESQKTLDIANAYMAAMSKGDMETIKSLMHDDMVWHNEGDSKLPWIGPWKGKKAIQEKFMPIFGENFKTLEWNPEDSMSSGDTAAFFGTMVGELTKSGEKTKKFSFALRVKVKDGKIIFWNWFEDSFEVSRAYHAKKK